MKNIPNACSDTPERALLKSRALPYRPDIDGLRAVAVIMVVLFHAFPHCLPGGFIGVDIFFVISGFLITGVIIDRVEDGKFSFRNFYARRILRIFPALSLVLGCVLLAALFILTPIECEPLGKHVLAGATFVSNILLYKEIGYFNDNAYAKPLLNLWSLGIEEQFYILFPFVIWICMRRTRLVTPLIVICCLLSFWDNIFLHVRHPSADFYLPLSRFWELLAGGALQASMRAGDLNAFFRKASHIKIPLALSGLALLATGLVLCARAENHYPGYMALLPVCGAFLLIWAGPDNWISRLLLSNKCSVLVGKLSYPLYLWHWPLLSFAWLRLGNEGWQENVGLRGFLVLIALVLAFFTWKLIERPIRFGPLFGCHKVSVLVASVFLVGLGGLYIYSNAGFPPVFADADKAIFEKIRRVADQDAQCLEYVGLEKSQIESCRYMNVGAATTIAVIGDSHAHAAWSGIAELGREMGFNTLSLGRFPPLPGEDAQNYENVILDALARKPEIREVIFLVRGAPQFYTKANGGERVWFDMHPRSYNEVRELFGGFIQKLVGLGKRVILLEDTPDLEVDVRDLIKWNFTKTAFKKNFPATPRRLIYERHSPFLRLQKELAEMPGVILVTGTLDAFCPDEECLVFSENGIPLYNDDDHLSLEGSAKLAREVLYPFLKGYLEKD